MGFNLCYEQLIGGSVTASEGAQFALACVVCGRAPGRLLANRCGDCGGAIDAIHPLENVSLSSGDNPIQRYFDLLPVRDRATSSGWATATPRASGPRDSDTAPEFPASS